MQGKCVGVAVQGKCVGVAVQGKCVGVAMQGKCVGVAMQGKCVGVAVHLTGAVHVLSHLGPDQLRLLAHLLRVEGVG